MKIWLAITLILLSFNCGFALGAWFVTWVSAWEKILPDEESDDAHLGI